MLENQLIVVVWVALWFPAIATVLCIILVAGKRLAAFGLLALWLSINVVVFGIYLAHCFSGCVDEPWYVLWSMIASLLLGAYLLVLIASWIWKWNAERKIAKS